MDVTDEIYRGLYFSSYESIKCLEILIDDKSFYDEISCINSLCTVSEFVASKEVRYIIFNKLHTGFDGDSDLRSFIKDVIFRQLLSFGVRKVLFLVQPNTQTDEYDRFINSEKYLLSFTSHNDTLDWIKSDMNKNILKSVRDQYKK